MQNQKGLPAQAGNVILIAVGIIAIIAIGVGAGYFLAQKSKIAEQKQAQDKQEQKEEVKDETADGKTYRNEEYGFEFKYPREFTRYIDMGGVGAGGTSYEVPEENVIYGEAIETDRSVVFDSNVNGNIHIFKGIKVIVWNKKWEAQQTVPVPHDIFILEEKDKKISLNIPGGYFAVGPGAFMGTVCMSKQIYIPYNEKTLILSVYECGDRADIYKLNGEDPMLSPPSSSGKDINNITNQILSTFKFIK